jgi:hypothetical protein
MTRRAAAVRRPRRWRETVSPPPARPTFAECVISGCRDRRDTNATTASNGPKTSADGGRVRRPRRRDSAREGCLPASSRARTRPHSPELVELRSERGNSFVDVESRYAPRLCRRAVEQLGDALDLADAEWAYLCESSVSGAASCGWVCGVPRCETLGVAASGAIGARYYCQICGRLLGMSTTWVVA